MRNRDILIKNYVFTYTAYINITNARNIPVQVVIDYRIATAVNLKFWRWQFAFRSRGNWTTVEDWLTSRRVFISFIPLHSIICLQISTGRPSSFSLFLKSAAVDKVALILRGGSSNSAAAPSPEDILQIIYSEIRQNVRYLKNDARQWRQKVSETARKRQ